MNGEKPAKVQMPNPISIMRAVRLHCLDCCGGSPKSVTWCTCDGLHSTRCDLWPFRFGCKPKAVQRRYGEQLITPAMMPGADIDLDTLPITPPRVQSPSNVISPEQRQALVEQLQKARTAKRAAVVADFATTEP